MPGVLAPGTKPISEMGPGAIRNAYVLYIGAGAVATAGIIALIRSIPLIVGSIRRGIKDVADARAGKASTDRRDQDLSLKFVGIGILVLLALIMLAPSLHMNLLGALLIVIFGAFFVTVSSRLTGEIGSTSNPISGMTIAALMLTCLVFLIVGWTGGTWYITALSVGGIVCIASSNGGTTSQDLKTGYLIGATPKLQQYSILDRRLCLGAADGPYPAEAQRHRHGVRAHRARWRRPASPPMSRHWATSANPSPACRRRTTAPATTCGTRPISRAAPPASTWSTTPARAVWLVDPASTACMPQRPDGTEVRKFDAPKATLVSYIIKGILDRAAALGPRSCSAPTIALLMEISGVPSLAFAVGVYLPIPPPRRSSSAACCAGPSTAASASNRSRPR